ncbi:MAG: GntR family transcriptional regulator [Tannerella sp.]|jgi:predicted RNA-binding protein (virulence factor B family)|nr:GntR family transcriptional regulator [Tannerella sp.]
MNWKKSFKKLITLETGKYNRLTVVKAVDFGLYLDGGEGREILLPARYVPEGAAVGDELEVFVYRDNEDRLIATTERPYAIVGEFQRMRVRDVARAGAFLDWGIMKDLLVPFREQKTPMKQGEYHLVYVYLDFITKRIVASARIDKFLDNTPPRYGRNEEVELMIANRTELGFNVIINNSHRGLLYHNEIFRTLSPGERCRGYIRQVREDDRIDVSLYPAGYGRVDGIERQILAELERAGGYLPVGDKSDAEEIRARFSCSKKSFKMAVGALYRKNVLAIEEDGIRKV